MSEPEDVIAAPLKEPSTPDTGSDLLIDDQGLPATRGDDLLDGSTDNDTLFGHTRRGIGAVDTVR